MPFTMPSYPLLNPRQASPYADLIKNALENYQSSIEARYKPLTTQAEAASKLAYANLMGPQFLAKLMGNTDILANMSEGQRQNALNRLYNAGSGQGTGASFLNQALQSNQSAIPSYNQNAGDTEVDLTSQNEPQYPSVNQPLSGNKKSIVEALDAWNQSKEAEEQGKREGYLSPPEDKELLKWYEKQQPSKSFSEKVGEYKGLVAEGEEAGKLRAKDIQDLNDKIFSAQTTQGTIDNISKILSSPQFEQIRQVPLLGHHELSYYSKFGSPEQQNLIGQYYTLTGDIIRGSARDFAGQFRKGEQELLEGMKPSPSDTVDTARGKTESLAVMNKMLLERSKLVSQIMEQHHVSKREAQQVADKKINGNEIRQAIHDRLNPSVTIKNKKTGEVMTVPISEARKMGISNV